jgi:hypothetical protein
MEAWSQPVADPHSRSVAPNGPTFASTGSTTQIRSCSKTSFFNDCYVKGSSRHSLVHILPTSSFKKCSGVVRVLTCWSANRTLATALCTFYGPHLPKVAFWNFEQETKLSLQSCALLSTTLPNRGPQPWKQRPYFGDHGSHFTWKNAGLRAPECFHPRIHTLWSCHSSQLLDDGWLKWWCGWHDETRAWWQDGIEWW